jgi:hypothetical protein
VCRARAGGRVREATTAAPGASDRLAGADRFNG